MMFLLHGTFYLYVLRTIFTGMADDANEAFDLVDLTREIFRCYICLLDLDSVDELWVHYDSIFHIMRVLKLLGLPLAMCIICRRFALLSEAEHILRPHHLRALAFYPNFIGSSIRMVAHPAGLCTDLQLSQIFFCARYQAVYVEHVRLHLDLFSDLHRSLAEDIITEQYREHGWNRPEISDSSDSPEISDSSDEENPAHTPP